MDMLWLIQGEACECLSFSLGAIYLLVWDSISYCPEPYQTGRADNWSVSPRNLTASISPKCWDEKQGWLQPDFKCTYSFLIMCGHVYLSAGPLEARRGYGIPRSRSYKAVCEPTCVDARNWILVLWENSKRLNCWDISPAPTACFLVVCFAITFFSLGSADWIWFLRSILLTEPSSPLWKPGYFLRPF